MGARAREGASFAEPVVPRNSEAAPGNGSPSALLVLFISGAFSVLAGLNCIGMVICCSIGSCVVCILPEPGTSLIVLSTIPSIVLLMIAGGRVSISSIRGMPCGGVSGATGITGGAGIPHGFVGVSTISDNEDKLLSAVYSCESYCHVAGGGCVGTSAGSLSSLI